MLGKNYQYIVNCLGNNISLCRSLFNFYLYITTQIAQRTSAYLYLDSALCRHRSLFALSCHTCSFSPLYLSLSLKVLFSEPSVRTLHPLYPKHLSVYLLRVTDVQNFNNYFVD